MRHLFPSFVRVPVLFFIIFGIVEFMIDSGEKPAFIEFPLVSLFLFLIMLFLIAIEAICAVKTLFSTKEKEELFKSSWWDMLYAKMTNSKPIEDEGEIILDHNYDGIKELDNSLPPWWVYSFYISIIFAAVYLLRYHVFDGPSQHTEYEIEMAKAKAAVEEYKKTAPDLVDSSTVTLLTDAENLSAGKAIWDTNCMACHMADGGGGIGPNITDRNWILGGGIKNVFNTISEGGRDSKGMIAWKPLLSATEIAQVASYMLTLEGTTPANPKAPEGDIWIDENTPE